jgi:hypothetical protein
MQVFTGSNAAINRATTVAIDIPIHLASILRIAVSFVLLSRFTLKLSTTDSRFTNGFPPVISSLNRSGLLGAGIPGSDV